MTAFDRRRMLILLATSLVSSCAMFGGGGKRPIIALLLPLTGDSAGLATEMRQAALNAVPTIKPAFELQIFDTHGTAVGAMDAAQHAASNGAVVILGPLFSREVAAVVPVAKAAPVITFSNDNSLIGTGAFVFGITPAQSIGAIFAYARTRGVRRVSVVAFDSDWGRQSVSAARLLAPRLSLSIQQTILLNENTALADLPARLQAGGNTDAVLLPDGGNRLAVLAGALRNSGLQLLGTNQWGGLDLTSLPGLQGAWFSGADTTGLSASSLPTILVSDAVGIMQELSTAEFSRATLMRPQGFITSLGHVRFLADGSVERELTVLGVLSDGIRVLSKAPA